VECGQGEGDLQITLALLATIDGIVNLDDISEKTCEQVVANPVGTIRLSKRVLFEVAQSYRLGSGRANLTRDLSELPQSCPAIRQTAGLSATIKHTIRSPHRGIPVDAACENWVHDMVCS
jgi:hypothetical protein